MKVDTKRYIVDSRRFQKKNKFVTVRARIDIRTGRYIPSHSYKTDAQSCGHWHCSVAPPSSSSTVDETCVFNYL